MADNATTYSIPKVVERLNKLLGPAVDQPFAIAFSAQDSKECLADLKIALQAAIALEFATIPPYLCGMWSIKDPSHLAAKSIREILHEEMLHMALACNMMAAIGTQPKLTTQEFLPDYPGKLKGDVHPGLEVILSGLSLRSLKVFMAIERPAVFPNNVERDEDDAEKSERTIGEFYDYISMAFQATNPKITTDFQITGALSSMVINDIDDVREAIETIKRQGEGSIAGPIDSSLKDLAHYFRFKEVYKGKGLKSHNNNGTTSFKYETTLPFPDVWPMDEVPKGGYQKKNVSKEVWHYLSCFDDTYSKMLDLLEAAWYRGGQASFINAMEMMFRLEKYALPLMQIPIPGKGGKTYGPCFRYKPESRRGKA